MLINGRDSFGMMVNATPVESISRPSSCSKPIVIGPRDRLRLAGAEAAESRHFQGLSMVGDFSKDGGPSKAHGLVEGFAGRGDFAL
jgi:hypothetical protein